MTAQDVAAVSAHDLDRGVDVVDGQGDAVHADVVRLDGIGVDRVGVHVLEEFDPAAAVGRRQHRDVGGVAVEPDGGVGPLPADAVTAQQRQAEVGEERDRGIDVTDGDADIVESGWHAPQPSHRTPAPRHFAPRRRRAVPRP